MPRANINGASSVRPFRLAYLVDVADVGQVGRAMEIASMCWGGKHSLLLPRGTALDRLAELAKLHDLDAAVDLNAYGAAQYEGLRHRGLSWNDPTVVPIGKPFNVDRFIRTTATLSTAISISGEAGRPIQADEWDRSSKYDALLTAMFGALSDRTEAEAEVHALVGDVCEERSVLTGGVPQPTHVPIGVKGMGASGTALLTAHDPWNLVVCIDYRNPMHLCQLWNLMALGHGVLPWPLDDNPHLCEYTSGLLGRVFPSDRQVHPLALSDEMPPTLVAMLAKQGHDSGTLPPLKYEDFIDEPSRVQTHLRRSFEVEIHYELGERLSAKVPIPELATGRTIGFSREEAGCQIAIEYEYGVPDGQTFRLPGLRPIAWDLSHRVSSFGAVFRGSGSGVVRTCRPNSSEPVYLAAIESKEAVTQLFKNCGFRTSFGGIGKWTSRIMSILGGARSTLSQQPAVREALDLASREGGASVKELRHPRL